MGIVRYPVRCAGCGESFRLRLTVGTDPRQPFYLACPICGAPTRGVLEYHGQAKTKLVLESGSILDEDPDGRPAVSVCADIPCLSGAAAITERGGSAFMHFSSIVGVRRLDAFNRIGISLRENLKEYGPALSRLTTYYRNGDWRRFDANLKVLFPEAKNLPTEDWHREDAIHRLWEHLVAPTLYLDGSKFFPDMKAEWNALWDAGGVHFETLLAFARTERTNEGFVSCHRDLLSSLERYANNVIAILPGALSNMVSPERQWELDELRLFRDEFETLRDLYVTSFEACHRSLRWIVGALNASQRGSPDAFIAPTRVPDKIPKSMKQYGGFTSARKRLYLEPLAVWDASWELLLDRQLRNAFGHASARHDLATGMILRDGGPALSYVRFIQKMHHVGHALLACSHALKLIRIYSFADGTAA